MTLFRELKNSMQFLLNINQALLYILSITMTIHLLNLSKNKVIDNYLSDYKLYKYDFDVLANQRLNFHF